MTPAAHPDPLIGRLVDGRYRVRARIARGGMATVYVATDLRLERRVALKVMHAHLSDDAVFQSRFIQEARAAARLADPHVVNVFDQGQDADTAYLVMEYLPGITLRGLLREHRRPQIPQTVTIMDAVLSGLAAAHRAGIVHRDVKPENVLLAEDGRIKIGDFGLARATSANTGSGAQLMGTIAYLAPELVTRGTADARSDIYSLGIMLYEMLAGEQPYRGEQPMQIAFQHTTDSVPRPSVKNPGVPHALDELVLWATAKDPEDRPADAGVMLTRLREIESELGIGREVAQLLAAGGSAGVDEESDRDGLTKVIPDGLVEAPAPTGAHDDNAARLRARTRRRRARGIWLLVLVLILAGAAGGTGWWFGSGPGSLVAVPAVTGSSFAQAKAALAADALVAVRRSENSLTVAEGTVIRTSPGPGTRLAKDARVHVVVSLGPAPVRITSLLGGTEDAARTQLADDKIHVAKKNTEFYTSDAKGTVVGMMLTPASGGKAIACGDGCDAHQGDAATLWVSLGALPSVVGMPSADAVSTLKDAGITVTTTREEYSADVAAGSVMSMAPRSPAGWWRRGDSTTLVVSKGPRPIPVPDVSGQKLTDAMAKIRAAGLNPQSSIPEALWGFFTATQTDPASGTPLAPGADVKVKSTGF